MTRVLLVQPSLQPPGGSKGVAAWIVEALKHDHAVSVLTWTPVDLGPINAFFGTSLQAGDFTPLGIHPVIRRAADLVPSSLGMVKWTLLFRACKRMKDDYDVIIGNNNEADFGRRGIQIIMYPYSYPDPQIVLPRFAAPLLRAYFRLCARWVDFSVPGMRQNLTLAVSRWTAARVRDVHGIDSTVVYPPVVGEFPSRPWAERENGFLCIGRIAPEKEIHKIIDVLARVRAAGHDVHLHIVGTPVDRAYYAGVRRRAAANAAWVSVENEMPRHALARLIATHRYGIHGMSEEHFGMAVGEMVQGGCIVFVPAGGGQVEIVGGEERLMYRSVDDAAAKIAAVLRRPSVQALLRTRLDARRQLFSAGRFMRQVHGIVRDFAAHGRDPAREPGRAFTP